MASTLTAVARPRFRPPQAVATGPRAPHALGYALFVIVNATLFIRPSEVVPALLGWEIYQYLIILTLVVSFPAILAQLQAKSLEVRPITVCVIGLLPAMILSHLAHARSFEALEAAKDFIKTLLYYLLFVGLVLTPGRLRNFLWWLGIFAAASTFLALLQYHEVIRLPTVKVTRDAAGVDAKTGEEVLITRLTGTGIFHDPNDFCILLVVSLILALYWLSDRASGTGRLLWLIPLGMFLYGLSLTASRGGLLAALAGVGSFTAARVGWRRAALAILCLLPVVLVLFAGRQTDFSAASGTGQDRLQLWREGVIMFKEAPLFGVGRDKYGEGAGQVAHNSYLHALTELGLLGGMLYLGAFAVALWSLVRLVRGHYYILDPQMRRLLPYLTGMMAGYAAGMMTLTLCYILPTYTMLGLASAYGSMTRTTPPAPAIRFDARLVLKLAGLAVLALAGFYVIVRLFAH